MRRLVSDKKELAERAMVPVTQLRFAKYKEQHGRTYIGRIFGSMFVALRSRDPITRRVNRRNIRYVGNTPFIEIDDRTVYLMTEERVEKLLEAERKDLETTKS